MDTVSKKKRSEIMQAIRGKDTKIEVLLRKALRNKGYRFRKNDTRLIGKPDIVFPKHKIAVFIDSCFWHGCPYHCRMPKSSRSYWDKKILRNKIRDKLVTAKLKKEGWKVIRFWEHSISSDLESCINKIADSLDKQKNN